MSEVFVIIPYSEPFETLYREVILSELQKRNFNVVRADEIPTATVVHDDILKHIRTSSLVIVEASEQSPNVYYELGHAQALGKELILLAQESTRLPFDTRHIRHLIYNPNNFDDLKIRFSTWVENTRAFSFERERKKVEFLNRGDVLLSPEGQPPKIIDATLYLQQQESKRTEILDRIESGSLLPCSSFYISESGRSHWIRLCTNPRYKFFQDSVQFLWENISKIIEAIGASVVQAMPDYISLGTGNGVKDEVILLALIKSMEKAGLTEPTMYYYPYDVNPMMLCHAILHVCRNESIAERIKIKAIAAEFEHLSAFRPVYAYRPEPNIISLLGNTIGNFENETGLLDSIQNAMFKDDILLLEIRLTTGITDDYQKVEPDGDLDLRKKFNFEPLALLGVPYDPDKLTYEWAEHRSQIPETRTMLCSYYDAVINGKRRPRISLGYIHYYSKKKFAMVLEALGFDKLLELSNNNLAVFVLKKVID